MKISKQIIALSLATCLTASPLMVSANNVKELVDIVPISGEVINEIEEELRPEYVKYEGKIVKIEKREKSNSILVKDNEEEEFSGQVYHLGEGVIIIDAKTKEIVDEKALKEGMMVTSFSHKNTPVAESMPPQSTPNIILINQGEDTATVNVSKFNEDLVNVENTVKILIEEKTEMVNQAGEKVEKEDLVNRDLIVFYSISTKSIPAQAPAHKIILLDEKEEPVIEEELDEVEVEDKQAKIQALDKIIINEEEISLEKKMYSKDGMIMIPLRQIAESLGYEVTWDNARRTAELTKGPQWTSVTIGQDNYNFAKMLVKLGSAPSLNNSSTFVPFTFLEEVLQVNLEITQAGVMKIIE